MHVAGKAWNSGLGRYGDVPLVDRAFPHRLPYISRHITLLNPSVSKH